MNPIVNIIETNNFQLVFEDRDARVYTCKAKGMLICELLTEYIPIEIFKDVFHKISDIIKGGGYSKFIFDKRTLKAFHQPSMEWYFLQWKNEMLVHGLQKHRKILPAEKWFEKMVMIAKEQIMKNNPDNVIDKLDIKYCGSLEEAIEV
ncbi:hypothetical protein [Anditalea andensis]|uniref:Uncharacterized protein n=1 Tax=Anditalea andensis TaxID=1048983 RepID=A0A074L4T4_9BACT|nr:hypothetical protein [Anditalea andensis]KEO74868.1 hypothetical protein EL17_04095 [Anditalea andensis]